MNLELVAWTDITPKVPGRYIYKPATQHVWYLVTIDKGDWRLAQNPEVLYISGLPPSSNYSNVRSGPLAGLESGRWFGPIPDIPK